MDEFISSARHHFLRDLRILIFSFQRDMLCCFTDNLKVSNYCINRFAIFRKLLKSESFNIVFYLFYGISDIVEL
jgi:hypothetical protein